MFFSSLYAGVSLSPAAGSGHERPADYVHLYGALRSGVRGKHHPDDQGQVRGSRRSFCRSPSSEICYRIVSYHIISYHITSLWWSRTSSRLSTTILLTSFTWGMLFHLIILYFNILSYHIISYHSITPMIADKFSGRPLYGSPSHETCYPILSYHIVSWQIISHNVMSHPIISYQITSYYIASRHII